MSSPKKRKDASDTSQPVKRPKPQPKASSSLIGPHEDIISQLQPKYDILPRSVISSTQIRKRVTQMTCHLCKQSDSPSVALLYARPADVCKLITIIEQCKRIIKGEGKSWFQYNQMFEVPEQDKAVVEETVLEGQEAESSDDGFEVMASRFEKAVLPAPKTRVARSMRVFLSVDAIGDLKGKSDITTQSSEDGT